MPCKQTELVGSPIDQLISARNAAKVAKLLLKAAKQQAAQFGTYAK